MWMYSPSSEIYLKRFLNGVRPPDVNNKWVKRFKRNIEKYDEIERNSAEEDIKNVVNLSDSDAKIFPEEKLKEITREQQNFEDVLSVHEHENTLLEYIETDLQDKFTDICDYLLTSPQLFSVVAEKISNNCIEKFVSLILGHNNFDPLLLELFYKVFFQTFLKREYTWVTLNVLINAYKMNTDYFMQYILVILFKNIEISHKILFDFVKTLNKADKLLFLTKILETQLSKEEFSNNLLTIFTLYKETKNNHYIQKCMEENLIKNSEFSSKENVFGKLLLAFMQDQKQFGKLNDYENFKKCMESHQTPFKKPCLNILNEIYQK